MIDGEVMIIDEFTGRILEGRRWSEGLHQAIEAKEGVRDPRGEPDPGDDHPAELLPPLRQALRDDRHGAHRGDRVHEDLQDPVVEIPTNVPMVRADHNDQIFKTKDGKWKAVASARSPSATSRASRSWSGTVSVEVSEMISDELKRDGIDHVVLNAKPEHAQREGETIAQAGRKGAVTIATNMAGRGVDIKLGGDPEVMAKAELRKLGVSPRGRGLRGGAGCAAAAGSASSARPRPRR